MFKRAVIAVAIVFASPAFVSAQDIFWSFSPTQLITNEFQFTGLGESRSGSVYIFAEGLFSFDALDLDFTVCDPTVIEFTGGTTFNDPFTAIGGTAFDLSAVTIGADGASGNLFALNTTQNGISPPFSALFNPHFEASLGPNGAVLLARLDFDILNEGIANLDFALGSQGALQLPDFVLNPSLGSATLETDHWPSRLGDLNDDDDVDFLDIAPFISALSNAMYTRTADCNQDCVVDFFDIAPFIAILTDQ